MPSHQRADARRNYTRILTVAEEQVAAHGANASLEQIARIAGVGSATVRRHFPTRRALLDAVSRKRIETLRLRAEELSSTPDSRSALLTWLSDVIASSVASQGLAAALALEAAGPDLIDESTCGATLEAAGTTLLRRAQGDGAVAPHITIDDLITLLVGIVFATEHHPDRAAEAERLFRLTVTGLSPER